MTTNEWLILATEELEIAGIGTPRLDCLVLLENVLIVDRAQILANPDTEISSKKIAQLAKLLNRRAKHEPIAYILGRSEFYGREFIIDSNVLVPRPESEAIIDMFIDLIKVRPCKCAGKDCACRWKVADVGCGSGALGITAALEVPNLTVEMLEIDEKAIEIAKTNVDKFTIGISVIKSKLIQEASADNDILLCNLPYVPDEYAINTAATHEPDIALFGGPDGLDLYRELFSQIEVAQHKPLYLLIESLPSQHAVLANIADSSGYALTKTNDFIQLYEFKKPNNKPACVC